MKYICWMVAGIVVIGGCKDISFIESGNSLVGIQGELAECLSDSIKIYESDGFLKKPIRSAPLIKSGSEATFLYKGKVPSRGFYYVGLSADNLLQVILGGEDAIKMAGNASNLAKTMRVDNSPQNENYQKLKKRVEMFNQQGDSLLRWQESIFQNPRLSQRKQREIAAPVMAAFRKDRQKFQDSVSSVDSYFSTIVNMSLRPLFDIENNPKKYPNALHHFAHEYFADIDFTDEDLSYMMPLWENVGTYTRTLVRAPEKFMRKDSVYFFLDQLLQKPKKTSRVYRLVLSGITSALHEEESSQLQKYAALYAKAFPEEKEIIGQHKSKTDALIAQEKDLQQFLVGATPPEIALPNEVGAMVTLSSQKGKYVLVEFWSSSSLPSKRQLPTLAKLYKRYKDKGFEIMSIGIEKNKKEWSEIILQGKMTWLNVSDLLGWNSPLVQTYHIKDVPANYLLDKEGKIVAKNIFGKELEATLYNLFPLTEDKRTGK